MLPDDSAGDPRDSHCVGAPTTDVGTRPKVTGQHYALYGNIAIQRSYSMRCRRYSLVLDGRLACCNTALEFDSNKTVRMSEAR